MSSRPLRTFTVLPHLPARLHGLQKLAYNLWWCWQQDAVDLFERIDRELWNRGGHNPVQLLGGDELGAAPHLGG